MSESNAKNIGSNIISIIAIILSLIAIGMTGYNILLELNEKEVTIEIQDFKLEYDENGFGNNVSYIGEGIVKSSDNDNYLVLVEVELTSGGSRNSSRKSLKLINVANGIGKIKTYDFDDLEYIEKPVYDFHVVGITELK